MADKQRAKVLRFLKRPVRRTEEERALAVVVALHFLAGLRSDDALQCWGSHGDAWYFAACNERRPAQTFPTITQALISVLREEADTLEEMIGDPDDDGEFRATYKADIKAARALADRMVALGGLRAVKPPPPPPSSSAAELPSIDAFPAAYRKAMQEHLSDLLEQSHG
jgi:hypothetical protein